PPHFRPLLLGELPWPGDPAPRPRRAARVPRADARDARPAGERAIALRRSAARPDPGQSGLALGRVSLVGWALAVRGAACQVNAKRVYLAVAACAVVVHLGALWNRFAMDDLYIIVWNPLVHSGDGLWRAFVSPYWPPDLGGKLYRPLTVATYTVDGLVGYAWWFHAVNLAWHTGAAVAITALARRWAGWTAALVAGL